VSEGLRAAGRVGAALVLAACSPPFRPVAPPAASYAGTGVRIDAMAVGPQGATAREVEGGMQLWVTTHAPPGTRIVQARLTRTTRRACSGGALAVLVQVDGPVEAPLPAPVGGDHALVVGFRTTPEEALEGPTALDVVVEQDGHLSCVRTELGPSRDWARPQRSLETGLTGGAPLRPLGDMGSPWVLQERLGALLGPVDVSAGPAVGLASCTACVNTEVVLVGPSAAATYYPFTTRPLALGLTLSYASLFELERDPNDPSGTAPHLGEWYQVPGIALQLDWLVPPRNSRVRLRGRDFSDWGVEVFEQLWIPTLHAERPTNVLGLGLVTRVAL
jgi:hypothetical protein